MRAVWVWLPASRPEPLSPFVTVTGSKQVGPPLVPRLVPGLLLAWARRGPDGAWWCLVRYPKPFEQVGLLVCEGWLPAYRVRPR